MNKGFIGASVLWILAGVSALSFVALAFARAHRSQSSELLDQERAVMMTAGAQILEKSRDFTGPLSLAYESGDVEIARQWSADRSEVLISTTAKLPHCQKVVLVRWRKSGGRWIAVSWKET